MVLPEIEPGASVKCIVTAGPTYESLDQVRRLTNFSTGKLGCDLASHLQSRGHEVVLLKGYYSIHPGEIKASEVATFTTTADLSSRLQTLAQTAIDAVFHVAAVSDFAFGAVYQRSDRGDLQQVRSGKFSTRGGTLLVELVPTPKIIARLREWYPRAQLVGWKYEVDGTRADAINMALAQMENCRTDACVVNGPAYGEGFGRVVRGESCEHLTDAPTLFTRLEEGLIRRASEL